MKKINIFLYLLLCINFISFTQVNENTDATCNDGIDNDGDGLVDCYDNSCYDVLLTSDCQEKTVFLRDTSSCQIHIPTVDQFEFKTNWESAITASDRFIPAVGDIDNDGETEVVVSNFGMTYVLDGSTGEVEAQIQLGRSGDWDGGLAIANIIGDDNAEIIFSTNSAATILTYDGTTLIKYKALSNTFGNHRSINIADFNQDGFPEIVIGGTILSNELEIITTCDVGVSTAIYGTVFSVPVDILNETMCSNCEGLELVAGNSIFAINFTDSSNTLVKTISSVSSGVTSIADMDMDGDLDVVGMNQSANQVFIWDGQTEELLYAPYSLDNNTAGRPNIADFDNDGKPEIGIATKSFYAILEPNATNDTLVELVSTPTSDPSGVTGSTVFDFEGDGLNEVVYRDNSHLRVYRYDTTNKTLLEIASTACGSITGREYPVVVDVNDDDETEILCGCNTDNGDRLKSFSADGFTWTIARKVWNQHAYFNVNINDDLSVPKIQSSPNDFAGNTLNNFLVQSTYVNPVTGEPVFLGRDIAINTSTFQISGDACSDDKIIIEYDIYNDGNLKVSKNTPISYSYRIDGNFDNGGSNGDGEDAIIIDYVDSVITTYDTIHQIDTIDFRGVPFDLFVQVNANTSSVNTETGQGFIFGECNETTTDSPYANNGEDNKISGLDTCKSLVANDDHIYLFDNDTLFHSIFENDEINYSSLRFSNDEMERVSLNLKQFDVNFDITKFQSGHYFYNNAQNIPGQSPLNAEILDYRSDSTDANGIPVIGGIGEVEYAPLLFAPYESNNKLVDSFTYVLQHSTIESLRDTAVVYLHYVFKSEAPEGFYPSNGGTWVIPNFTKDIYPDNKIEIFNRWGNKVFEAAPYDSDWEGVNNNGEDLPAGTYYYVLDKGFDLPIEKGFVYIKR